MKKAWPPGATDEERSLRLFKGASDLRALHDRIFSQLPKRQLTAFEAASETLE